MSSMRTFWLYTLARFGLIIAVGLVLFPFLGLNLVMAIAAIIIGALLSYLLLGKLRAKAATEIEAKVAKRASKPKRVGADEAAEDEIVEERLGEDGDQSK